MKRKNDRKYCGIPAFIHYGNLHFLDVIIRDFGDKSLGIDIDNYLIPKGEDITIHFSNRHTLSQYKLHGMVISSSKYHLEVKVPRKDISILKTLEECRSL